MGVLIFGAAGMLGQALASEAGKRGLDVTPVTRSDADVTDDDAVKEIIQSAQSGQSAAPALVINSAAIVDLAICEADPGLAHSVNARAVGVMAAAAHETGAKFVQISTDQYFTGDGAGLHDEAAPVVLLNEYARSKFAGEELALGHDDALILRINVTGFRGDPARPTFAEWAIDAISSATPSRPVTGFVDYYTSTMDAGRLAAAALDLVDKGATGLYNVASREVASKFDFLQMLAKGLQVDAGAIVKGKVAEQNPRRAESLGLDVTKAEAMLGYRLPTQSAVVTSLLQGRREQA